jgi:hypothetical protein
MLLTKTRYDFIINLLEQKAKEALPEHKVLKFPYYFASPQDFAAQYEESATYSEKTYKVKYLMFEYGTFVNSKTKGCEDDPNLILSLKFQLYRTLQQHKIGDVNSHDLLVSDVIAIRNKLLGNLDLEYNRVTIQDIIQMGDMITAQPCQFVIGDLGDWVNVRLNIEVNHEE